MKYFSLAFFLCLFAVSQAQAQEMIILTVDQCIESALKKNALIGISQEHIQQAQARITQGQGAMLPVLSTDVYGAVSTDQPVFSLDTMIKQPLFLGGELIARREKAEAYQVSRFAPYLYSSLDCPGREHQVYSISTWTCIGNDNPRSLWASVARCPSRDGKAARSTGI